MFEFLVALRLVRRQVQKDQQPIHTRRRRRGQEAPEAVDVGGVQIGIEDNRHRQTTVTQVAHAAEYPRDGRTRGERAAGGGLVDGAIGEGIGKRDAHFQHVYARFLEREREPHGLVEVRVTGGNVGDEPFFTRATQPCEDEVDPVGGGRDRHGGGVG